MVEAAKLAAAGAPDGTVVVAGEQTAGQGRLGRSWHSEPEAGLYMTCILRPRLPAENLPVTTLALGLATSEAIAAAAGVACDLRWPNDVLTGGKKVAGILCQLTEGALLAGIGVNVNHREFPYDIAPIATSLLLSTGREHSREELMQAVAASVENHIETLRRDGSEPVLRAFSAASSFVRGRRVTVEQGEIMLRGTTDGVDSQGFLILLEDNGRRTTILAGGVRPECSSR